MSKVLTKDIFIKGQEYARQLCDGLTSSSSPFHSVETVKNLLNEAGFKKLIEGEMWELEAGGKYYTTRNNTTLGAFLVGRGCEDGAPETFKVIGCHTDSPVL